MCVRRKKRITPRIDCRHGKKTPRSVSSLGESDDTIVAVVVGSIAAILIVLPTQAKPC